MDQKDKNQDFSLEEIMQEFASDTPEFILPDEIDDDESFAEVKPEIAEPEDTDAPGFSMAADTIRLDMLSLLPKKSDEAEPQVQPDQTLVLPALSPEEPVPDESPAREVPDLTAQQRPVSNPIQFRSRLSELKRKLVAGPEKRYYDLTEVGLGRVQLAIFLNLLIVLLCTGGSAMYAMGMVAANRLRLMIFSQILAMMLSVLLGCYVLMDGIVDLFTGKFSLNTMLFLTLAACAADAMFCLEQLRVPCCAAFCLEMTFALWNRSLRRRTEMGQMDTLRKASRLDGIVKVPDHMGNGPAVVRTEGRVEDFMDHYAARTGPEKAMNIYAAISILGSIGVAVLAGLQHDLSLAIQVFSTSMLVAVPAGAFVSQSRPAAILGHRLHMVGTVLCGWKGIKSLCGKASFPLFDRDIFPQGTIKLNGVKFLGDRVPEDVISAAASLAQHRGGGLEPVFTQLSVSHGCQPCEVEDFCLLPGGLGGMVSGENCLLGLSECLKEQGVEIPDAALVNNAVYFSVNGILTAVFVLSYSRTKASAAGLVTINGCRKLRPMILCRNFMITPQLMKEKFGIRPKRYDFPAPEVRDEFAAFVPDPELLAGALTTQLNLSSMAYAVTGARVLRGSCRTGLALHVFAGIVGLLIMAALAYLGDTSLLSPINILLYQLVWLLPGLLITEWVRTV